MIAAPFDYLAPTTLAEAIDLLARHREGAKLLAGGQSLVPMMKMRLAVPEVVIDLNRISELSGIRRDGDSLRIGAMARHRELEASDLIRQHCPLLAQCAAQIGDLQVRNRGTLGGSLGHTDPAADYPAALLAADVTIQAAGPDGERSIAIDDFFLDLFTTALQPGEVITEVRAPLFPAHTGGVYLKFEQKASGFALCGVAARVTLAGDAIGDLRIGITGVAPCAYRPQAVEDALRGQPPDADRIAQAAGQAAAGVDLLEDIHAGGDYRAHLARILTRRALRAAVERAA